MATTTKQLMTTAAVATALLLGAVVHGLLSPGPEAAQGHIRIGTAPAGSYALWATSVASAQVQQAILGSDAGMDVYVRSKVCAVPDPDGGDPGEYAVPGLVVVYDDSDPVPCDPASDAQVEAWIQGRPDAPWSCACAVDATCTTQLPDGGVGPAPLGNTLGTGAWAGPGCVPKPCAELSGLSSWPAVCPLQ